jgi:cation diffusion facilitator CzcD-associated flavoprotein CzcO
VVVVGGGPAGLAVAAELGRRAVRAPVLEQGAGPGWAWANHYDGLRLHTPRRLSNLPGRRLPRGEARYPGRDEFAAYLRAYAAGLELHPGVRVESVERAGDAWRVKTGGGDLEAASVVVAAGFNRLPVVPELPGRNRFRGAVVHSSEVRGVERWRGRSVLVVGLGNSGADLALALHGTGARVAVAVRDAVHPVPVEILGINWRTLLAVLPLAATAAARRLGTAAEARAWWLSAALWDHIQRRHAGDLASRGLALMDRPALVRAWRQGRAPLTRGELLDLVRAGEVRLVRPPGRLLPGGALLPDGERLALDAVVLATGFAPGLAGLLPGEVAASLAERPLRDGPVAGASGLYLCGYQPELVRIRRAARRIAREVARRGGRYQPGVISSPNGQSWLGRWNGLAS